MGRPPMGERVISNGSIAFFFDRPIGQSVPRALRTVGVNLEIHDEVYDPRASIADEVWIKAASTGGKIIISRDRRIRYRPAERKAFLDNNARMSLLSGNATRFDMLRSFLRAWDRIDEMVHTEQPPFIALIYDSGSVVRKYP